MDINKTIHKSKHPDQSISGFKFNMKRWH